MRCYNHIDKEAVGICKSCHKGVCKECLTEIDIGIACTATCIEEVKLLNSLINKSKQSHTAAAGTYIRNAVVSGVFGIVFIAFGIYSEIMTTFSMTMGVVFIVGAIFNIVSANKYKNLK